MNPTISIKPSIRIDRDHGLICFKVITLLSLNLNQLLQLKALPPLPTLFCPLLLPTLLATLLASNLHKIIRIQITASSNIFVAADRCKSVNISVSHYPKFSKVSQHVLSRNYRQQQVSLTMAR